MAVKYESLAVGTKVNININGTARKFIVVHQGNPSTSYYDRSCEGTWLMLAHPYSDLLGAWNTSAVNDYEKSGVHATLNEDIYNKIDSEVREFIKEVKIPYTQGTGADATVKKGANGLTTKIFLPSVCEIFAESSSDADRVQTDGVQLDYFKNFANGWQFYNENVATSVQWWTRSPYKNSTSLVLVVKESGTYEVMTDYVNILSGVYAVSKNYRPMFIVDSGSPISGSVTIGGVSKELSGGYANIGGVWKEIVKTYTNVNGIWKE